MPQPIDAVEHGITMYGIFIEQGTPHPKALERAIILALEEERGRIREAAERDIRARPLNVDPKTGLTR